MVYQYKEVKQSSKKYHFFLAWDYIYKIQLLTRDWCYIKNLLHDKNKIKTLQIQNTLISLCTKCIFYKF